MGQCSSFPGNRTSDSEASGSPLDAVLGVFVTFWALSSVEHFGSVETCFMSLPSSENRGLRYPRLLRCKYPKLKTYDFTQEG